MVLRRRADLETIQPYRQRMTASAGVLTYKLSSNENPYPPLPSVRSAIAAGLASANRYPQASAEDLAGALTYRYGVAREEVVLGAGSSEVISALIRAVAGPGDEVLYAWRSFELYPSLVIGAGAQPVTVPLSADVRHDLPGLAAAVTDATRLVLVCNPNNPTGTIVTATELEEFLARVPEEVTVVIDEAYLEFQTDPDSLNSLDFFGVHPNVAVCRTFSKAHGLAGLRVGYALAPAELAEQARKLVLPFSITDLAQRAALASLVAEAELEARVRLLVERRERVETALSVQGWNIPPSQANFIWLPSGGCTDKTAVILNRHGLACRVFPGEGVRITIGEEESVRALIEAAAEAIELFADC